MSLKSRDFIRNSCYVCNRESAKEIGIYDKVGSISVGKQADFVLIDEELNIKRVYIDGKEIIC